MDRINKLTFKKCGNYWALYLNGGVVPTYDICFQKDANDGKGQYTIGIPDKKGRWSMVVEKSTGYLRLFDTISDAKHFVINYYCEQNNIPKI